MTDRSFVMEVVSQITPRTIMSSRADRPTLRVEPDKTCHRQPASHRMRSVTCGCKKQTVYFVLSLSRSCMSPKSRKKRCAQQSKLSLRKRNAKRAALTASDTSALSLDASVYSVTSLTSVDSNGAFGFIAHVPSLTVIALLLTLWFAQLMHIPSSRSC